MGFLLTYRRAVSIFAWLFVWTYSADKAAFTGTPPSFSVGEVFKPAPSLAVGEFFFFSLTTITTVGLSPIHPVSALAEFLVSLELVLGLVLIVGVFGVFVAQHGHMLEDSSATQPKRRPAP